MKNQYKLRIFDCLGCGNHIEKRCPAGTSYCSIECYRKSKRPNSLKGQQYKCLSCGIDVYRNNSSKKNKVFCSIDCHNQHQSINKVSYNCKICNKLFVWSKSRKSIANPTYCSIGCRNKCPEWKLKSVIAGNLKQQKSKQPTRLEIAGKNILLNLGIDFEEQVLIENKFVVDVLLKNKKIIIQWDGDYWHGYRKENDKTPLDNRQQKRVNLDKSQDAYMLKCGYTILRFWEHEVYKQKEKVIETIKKSI